MRRPCQLSAQKRVNLEFPHQKDTDVVDAENLLRASWAIVLARYSDTNDVCFGTVVAGRRGGLERVVGPVCTAVPIRIRIHGDSTIQALLQDVHNQALEMDQHVHFGLENLAQLSSDAKDVCDFSSLLVIEREPLSRLLDDETAIPLLEAVNSNDSSLWHQKSHPSCRLLIELLVHDDLVELRAQYEPLDLMVTQIDALIDHFVRVFQHLSAQDASALRDVSMVGPRDIERAIAWSGQDPQLVDACVHEVIQRQAQHHSPDAMAIQAWDGQLTYNELDRAADRLACYIRGFDINIEGLVHVCFEKSMWFWVSILAINKAGAAWVPFETKMQQLWATVLRIPAQ